MDAATAWAEAMKFGNRPNPYPYFEELRRTPVAKVADNTYVVTGYPELLALAHDPRISSDISRSPAGLGGGKSEPEPGGEHMQAYGREASIIVTDPPDHDRARRQVMRHFGPPHSPDLIPSMEPFVVRLAGDLLDRVRARGGTRLDVVEDFAYPIPVAVICKILGVPVEHEQMFHAWIFDFMMGTDLGPEGDTDEGRALAEKGRASTAALLDYLGGLVDGYAKAPGDGLLSKLLHDDGPDGPMSIKQATSNAMLLLVAGHDSTVNTITNCVMTLLRNPGSWDLMRDRPELIPRTIEEVQRLQSAVQFFPSRSATADIEVGGTVIPAGSAVHLVYAAANRDPRRFESPDRFDPLRDDNEHFGWGSGIHTCMGGPLARLEVNLALETFLRRVDSPELVVDPPPYRHNQVFRGPRHLWVDFAAIAD
ncbi:cytochrome [Mycobacterium sp. 852002-53434_SCH5985345]|uniref:cytochrome P450 n=1 Tax=unclassified Mycobacterium TaxID=2642494 RepID=UPI0007FD947E|nr:MULTISPECIES: cytochrome P450 [unclassified Mycobacterium]OBF50941.1 cytochrome [Mycobacterium sp. 852002-53434_SCH5985345]OBF78415.1 cytochrome [Mycobacterium sp. 852002-51613_SCH5001154]OBF97650.1 cytochrome [Mycobacterium sp. 852014-52450_SCH5900713]